MIIISSRRDFDDPDRLSRRGHTVREVDLGSGVESHDLNLADSINAVAGKRLLVLVHGYNNEQQEVYDAYQIIEGRVASQLPGSYEHIVGYAWPAADQATEWRQAKSRANAVARLFRFLLEQFQAAGIEIDLMTHSLGARVALKALKETTAADLVRNVYCMAGAVDNECLEAGEEFGAALAACQRLFVLHSARDGVLRFAYQVAEWDQPLGLNGPEDRDYISRSAKNVFVANCKKVVGYHGAYKRSGEVFGYIGRSLETNPARFRTLRPGRY
jgi:esterase/lipase superfamily enzyme